MAEEIFLARTEEQEKFKQVLRGHHKTLWQVLQTPVFPRPKPVENGLPYLLLFYGEGGMGKTRLSRRLLKIVEEEAAFKGKFHALFLDWEQQQKLNLNLQVGHDYIHPETVLAVLHEALNDKGWGGCFDEYRRLVKQLKEAEAKVDEELKKAKPDSQLQTQVRKLGAKGVAWIIRQAPGADVLPSKSLEPALETVFQVGAEGMYQARQFVQKALTPEEYDIYAQPHERLAEALGKGMAQLAKRKPLVVFLDTYEIVDRPECDYTLRRAIQYSGQRVVWVIAGRANLADSGQRGKGYFRGYKRDFPEERVYAKSLSEFGDQEIRGYFERLVPGRALSDEDVEAVARFSLGIPFVIAQAGAMWKEGKPIAEIVAPVPVVLGETTSRQEVVKATCDRFLMHCFSAKERERDLQAVYGLAMMRRPDATLLKEMLDVGDLEQTLQSLRERYSFIWVERVRLDEKLAQFLRDYLLEPIRRESAMVQQLNEQAIAWLELQLGELTRDIVDTAERLQEERIVKAMADLAHHHFWQGEEEGWRYLVPRAVEGLQYNRAFARSLLEVAEVFSPRFSRDGVWRLQLFSKSIESFPDPEDFRQMLEELEKLAGRKWLDGEGEEERKVILLLEWGRLCYRQEKYREALQVYLEVERRLPEGTGQLRKNLAEEFYILSGEFIWPKGSSDAVYAAEEKQTIERAIALHKTEARYHNYLGVIHAKANRYEEAIAAWRSAINLDPKHAPSHCGLGFFYNIQGKYELAIAAWRSVIALDPKDAFPHNELGNVYQNQGKYEEAIAAYQSAIELDPKHATPHNNLGNVYQNQGKYEEAIAAYQSAIELDPKDAYPHHGLGNVYNNQSKYEEAIAAYQRAIELAPEYVYAYRNIGSVNSKQGNYEEAIAAYENAIALDPKYDSAYNGLGWTHLLKDDLTQAKEKFEKAINLDLQESCYVFNLGLVYALQGNLEEACDRWKKGLTLCQGTDTWDRAIRVLYTVAVGDTEQGITQMQKIVDEDNSAVGALRNALEDAEVLARCPVKIEGIDTVVEMLKQAISG